MNCHVFLLSSVSVESPLVSGGGSLPDCSLCHLHEEYCTQPWLCGPESSGGNKNGGDSVQCHTDLATCCTGTQGPHRGDWYAPGETDRLPFSGDHGDISENRGEQRVDLRRRNNANSPVGIYHCGIHTCADPSVRATLYVGLYTASGGMGTEL